MADKNKKNKTKDPGETKPGGDSNTQYPGAGNPKSGCKFGC